jgi:hypothetical protein
VLALHAEEFGAAMNSILCVIIFCVVQGCHDTLLQECLSLYHRIRGKVKERYVLQESVPSNFLLSVGKDRFESGKVVLKFMI